MCLMKTKMLELKLFSIKNGSEDENIEFNHVQGERSVDDFLSDISSFIRILISLGKVSKAL